jgi:hypothetical protein
MHLISLWGDCFTISFFDITLIPWNIILLSSNVTRTIDRSGHFLQARK